MTADSDITEDTPLRLAVAAELAFPAGGMTAAGLRKEAVKGRLVIERIAGKDFTTLRAIANMRQLCIVRNVQRSVGTRDAPPAAAVHCSTALVRIRMLLYQHRDDEKLKAAPMTRRERAALDEFYRSRGAFVAADGHWRRTVRWLELHGLVEVAFDRDKVSARITSAGEVAWKRVSGES